MKKQIFSGKLYVQSLKKIRTVGIAMLVTLVLFGIFVPTMMLIETGSRTYDYATEDVPIYKYDEETGEIISIVDGEYYDEYYEYIDEAYVDVEDYWVPNEVEDGELAPMLWGLVLFAPMCVYFMFSFLNERKKSDFFHSLPQTRTCMYLSMTAAIFTWLFVTILLGVGINSVLWSMVKGYTLSFETVLANVVFYSVLAIFMSGFMAVAMMITGTGISNILVYGFLLLFPTYAYTLFVECVREVTSILPNDSFGNSVLGFERFLPLAALENNFEYFADTGALVYSLVIGLLMYVLAGVLYHFRRSESATKSAPNNILQHAYRIAFATAVALLIPMVICMDGFEGYLLVLILPVVVVYLLYELMTTKKIAKMVKSLPLLIVPFVLSGVFLGAVVGVQTYVYSVRPDAEDVTSIRITSITSTYGAHQLSEIDIKNREAVEIAVTGLHNTLDRSKRYNMCMYCTLDSISNSNFYTVCYTLKNGRTIERNIVLSRNDVMDICMLPEIKDTYLSLPTEYDISSVYYNDIYLNSIYKKAVWEAFCADYQAMTDEEKLYTIGNSHYTNYIEDYVKYPDTDGYAYLWITFSYSQSGVNTGHYYYDFYLTPEATPRTLSALRKVVDSKRILNEIESRKELGYSVDIIAWNEAKEKYETYQLPSTYLGELIRIDEHLLGEEGVDVMIGIDTGYYWIKLTPEELAAVKENASVSVPY